MSLSSRFKKVFFPTEETKVVSPSIKPSKVSLKPDSFSQAPEVAKTLLELFQVEVDVSDLNADEVTRLIDFLAGVIYPFNGKILTSPDKKSYVFIIDSK